MPSVRKTRARRRKRRHLAAIRIQVHFLIKRPPQAILTAQFLREVFIEWIKNGSEPENIEVVYISWTHTPLSPRDGAREYPDSDGIEEAREKLRAVMLGANKSLQPGIKDHLYLKGSVS